MWTQTVSPEAIIELLGRHSFHCANEDELQRAVATVLAHESVGFRREVRLTPRDRVDFMVGSIALELKVQTDPKSVFRQALRYAEHRDVTAVIVSSTTHHALRLPLVANGKPLFGMQLRGW